jgi:hypothetical protein
MKAEALHGVAEEEYTGQECSCQKALDGLALVRYMNGVHFALPGIARRRLHGLRTRNLGTFSRPTECRPCFPAWLCTPDEVDQWINTALL